MLQHKCEGHSFLGTVVSQKLTDVSDVLTASVTHRSDAEGSKQL
jgi:hypothetical protein